MPSDQPIATRRFENCDGTVTLDIHAPTPHDNVGFDCRFVVRWPDGRTKEATAGGVDSMQALLLAVSAGWARMLYPKIGQRDETLTFLGNPDLDLRLLSPPDANDG